MKTCPACRSDVAEDAPRCDRCGELLISDEWRGFLERYDLASSEERQALRDGIPSVQREEFERVRTAWREAHPEDRTTSVINPVPKVEPTPAPEPADAALGWAPVVLPALLGLPLTWAVQPSAIGLGLILGAALIGAVASATRGSGARPLGMLTSWLAVALAAAVALYL